MNPDTRLSAWIRWWPAAALMLVIFLFSSLPAARFPTFPGMLELIIKKGGHILAYGILARSYLRGIGLGRSNGRPIAWLLAVTYAVTDEWHQSFVPGRGASWLDVFLDALGAGAGLWLWGRFIPGQSQGSG